MKESIRIGKKKTCGGNYLTPFPTEIENGLSYLSWKLTNFKEKFLNGGHTVESGRIIFLPCCVLSSLFLLILLVHELQNILPLLSLVDINAEDFGRSI